MRSLASQLAASVVAVVAIAASAGCTEVEEAAPHVHQPAHLEPIDGSDVQKVTFDERGAEQVSLQTASVQRRGKNTVVPYAALIYDGQGASWVYTSPEPLTYMRVAVDVVRIEDDRVLLRGGPRPGTSVVTTGAAEVYGAELEIAGGH
ncbi:hypothetical protein [Nocardioides sp.]|uniref:hypothetical protein n=1 Tax=Nocardioides sp. TaxID=35761 RepID=UPI002ED44283